MSRKREKPYPSRHTPYNFPKRRRPLPPPHAVDEDLPENHPSVKTAASASASAAAIVVVGLSPDCSVLDLKSRFEIYGAISRTRMDAGGVAYITFRSTDSAESAIAASLDPSFGITLNSNRVKVMRASDPVPQWREGVKQREASSTASKLVRPEVPLSRHGRGNKLGSAIVNLKDEDKKSSSNNGSNGGSSSIGAAPSRGREIIAYDDIL